jgi:acyl-CoA reductase-like NAD-dependent aldehyde dehydrogenase
VSSSSAPSVAGVAGAPRASIQAELERALARLADSAPRFARLPARDKAALLAEVRRRFVELSPRMVELGCLAQGIGTNSRIAGEIWFSGPVASLRSLRLFQRSLEQIAGGGLPSVELPLGRSPDERVSVPLTPLDDYERGLFFGLRCEAWLERGVTPTRASEQRAGFYRAPSHDGRVVLVLGAGNVQSISVLDVLYHSFVEGAVCLLKMNPVNDYLGPLYEQAFAPLVEPGFLAFAYGGAEVGAYLVEQAAVTAIHITGSVETHDRIVWGPPGEQRERRKREQRPLTAKPVTSELGNVSPALVLPVRYSSGELERVARSIAGMVINNASFNCNALKLVVTARGWPQREELLSRVGAALAREPTRSAYYPGAQDRYQELVDAAAGARVDRFGSVDAGRLPWTLISGLDPSADSPLLRIEPFCSLFSEVTLDAETAPEFLRQATEFVNERVFGTLNAMLFVPDAAATEIEVARALDRALVELRYGTVAINIWPAAGYGLGIAPWGGAPGARLANAESGIGWSHNSLMLEQVHKVVISSPLLVPPDPFWLQGHRQLLALGRALAAHEAAPSLSRAARTAWAGVRG